jgi:hypothetical protein
VAATESGVRGGAEGGAGVVVVVVVEVVVVVDAGGLNPTATEVGGGIRVGEVVADQAAPATVSRPRTLNEAHEPHRPGATAQG